MELRTLKYFLVIAHEENITKAANLLHLTQPTLSRQMMQLEDELGTKLFKRSNHNIVLTEDGHRLKQRAKELIELAEKTKTELACKGTFSGEIAIGCAETKNMSYLSEKIYRFRKQYPLVTFRIYSATADDVKEKIEQGLLDIGLLTEPVDISKYNFIRLKQREVWGVLVSKDSSLIENVTIRVHDLINVPLIMPGRAIVQQELASWFGNRFEDIEIAATYNLITNAANMVRYDIGVALCFDLDLQYDDLKFIPLHPPLETGVVLVWKKNEIISKLVDTFINC